MLTRLLTLSTITTTLLLLTSGFDFGHHPRPPLSLLGDSVPRAKYEALAKKAAYRLKGWNRAKRQARAWHHAATFRQGFVRAGLLCIHFNPRVGHGEGPWDDAGDPYWGGLQMDRSFMATYGRPLMGLGLANRWPPEAQLAVGTIAYYAGRGFYPWPRTARACGLIG